MPQGHQKWTQLLLYAYWWRVWWTKLPGKCSTRMNLLWLYIISGVFHLCTPSLLFSTPLYFIYFMFPSSTFFCDIMRLLGFSSHITFMSPIFLYSLYMAATALSTWFLMPFLAIICVNVTSMASLCMSCIHVFLLHSAGGKFGDICFPSKPHIELINLFSCVEPSWNCVRVFNFISFLIPWFYFLFIYVCFYLIWVLYVLIFNIFPVP